MGKERDIIKNLLQKDFRAITEWFFENDMVLNQKNVITCASVEIPELISLNLITSF